MQSKREQRHVLRDRAATVQIAHSDSDDSTSVEGELIDLSSRGAKLAVRENLQFSKSVGLRICAPSLDLDLSVDAQVCWMRESGRRRWVVGCSFVPEISGHILERLATGGFVDRRLEQRHPIDIQAHAKWQLDHEELTVGVRDYSDHGFCMVSTVAGEVGQQLMLRLPDGHHAVFGKVRWQLKFDETYLIGCMLSASPVGAEGPVDMSGYARGDAAASE